MTEDRLIRLEQKIDRLTDDVTAIKLTLAEYRGAGKVVHVIAATLGALAGFIASKLNHPAP